MRSLMTAIMLLCTSCSTDDTQECSDVGAKSSATGTRCVVAISVTENGRTTERCTQYEKYTDTYVCGSDHKWYLDKREPHPTPRRTND